MPKLNFSEAQLVEFRNKINNLLKRDKDFKKKLEEWKLSSDDIQNLETLSKKRITNRTFIIGRYYGDDKQIKISSVDATFTLVDVYSNAIKEIENKITDAEEKAKAIDTAELAKFKGEKFFVEISLDGLNKLAEALLKAPASSAESDEKYSPKPGL